ncbi:MAG: hypothetical protein AAB412_02985, partial [Elusimicrobiota bacterium]
AAFVLSIPLGAWMGIKSLPSAMAGVHAALAFWCTLGLPGLAVLLGASAGAGLRSEPMAEAEALLPVSPRRRVFSALASSLVHAALLSGVVLLAAFLLGPGLSTDKEWGRLSRDLFESVGLYLSLLGFALIFTLAAGLLFSYLFGHGILGGLLGAGLGAAAAASVGAAFILRQFFPESVGWDRLPEASMAAGIALVLAALGSAAPAVELKPARAWTASAAAVILSTTAAAVCACAFIHMRETAAHARELLRPEFLGDWGAARSEGSWAQRVFLEDREGTISAVSPEGARSILVPGEERPLRHLLDWPYWYPNRSTAWTPEGALWALRRIGLGAKERWELLRAEPEGGPLQRFAIAGERMDLSLGWREGRVVLLGTLYDRPGGGWSYRYAPVPAPGMEPRWKPVPSSRERVSAPLLAGLNGELRRLAGRRGPIPAAGGTMGSSGSREFEKALAVLRQEDARIIRRPLVLHRGPGSVWLFAGPALLRLDETGALLKRVELSRRVLDRMDDRSGFHVVENGIFHHDGRFLYFMDWEGNLRRLGRA